MAARKKKLVVKIKRLNEEAVIPKYAHDGDVGMDFVAIGLEYDKEKDLYIYHTGLAFESDFNYGQFLFPRSSNRKTDAYLCNSVGIADSAIYRGEILFCYKNRDSYTTLAKNVALNSAFVNASTYEEFKNTFFTEYANALENQEELALNDAPYMVGEKVGQMVMLGYPTVEFKVVDELSETERGDKGFGSTDEKKE